MKIERARIPSPSNNRTQLHGESMTSNARRKWKELPQKTELTLGSMRQTLHEPLETQATSLHNFKNPSMPLKMQRNYRSKAVF